MKPKHALVALASSSLVLSSAVLTAQEKTPDSPLNRENMRPPGSERERLDSRYGGPPTHERAADQEVPTPFIGVVTRELEAEVRAQTGVPEGFGLLVVEVMPDGPAALAGLRQHDVLIRLDDQQLINVDQFMVLIRNRQKGDEISINLKRAGVEQTIKVKVGERNLPPMHRHGHDAGFELPIPNGGRFRYEPPQGGTNPEWQERMEKFQNQMREYQQRIQDWSRERSDRPHPQPPRFKESPSQRENWNQPGNEAEHKRDSEREAPNKRPETNEREKKPEDPNRNITMHGNAVRTDDSGIYSIRRQNDRSTFSVRLKGGDEKTWPINTPQEREAVPAEYRERLTDLEKILRDGQ